MNTARWHQLPKRIQLLSIMAELERARVWESDRGAQFTGALGRALDLIDLTLADLRWKEETLQLLTLRDEIAGRYAGVSRKSTLILSQAL